MSTTNLNPTGTKREKKSKSQTAQVKIQNASSSSLDAQRSKSLYELFLEKLNIEEKLQAEGGEITDDMDVIWQSSELVLKDKIDAYGYALEELEAEEKKVKNFETELGIKMKRAKQKLENLRAQLKKRLFKVADNKPLRGHIFNFHPFETSHRFIREPALLKPEEAYLAIEIREDIWNKLEALHEAAFNIDPNTEPLIFKLKDRKGKVSELPKDHPAVGEIRTPSVMIT